MSKLAGKNQKWGRCHVPGHSKCSVINEIRHPVSRRTAKLAHLKQETNSLFEICPCCGKLSHTVETRRRNTQYYDDDLNYTTVCIHCFVEEEIYWAEQWAEYWSGRL